ncbi:hypothetical protein QBC45DRAFT_404307 [Copromyces sp. CBS 386.78]|nr:hypothetical protein QBC45DRAFT_404307 [Copromyces sp. CBS 386.78]
MPFTSPFKDLDIPTNVDVWSLVFDRKDVPFPTSKRVMTCAENTKLSHTWDQIRAASIDFGQGMKDMWKWKKGEVLALYTPNSIDTPIVTLGAIWAGAVVSPANPLYTVEELTFQLKDSGAKAIITQAPFLKTAVEAAKKAGIPNDRIILIGQHSDPSKKFKHFRNIKCVDFPARFRKANINPEKDLVFLVYSSGTTGLPKGVCLTHLNVVSNILQSADVDGRYWSATGGLDGEGDKFLGVLPFFHIYGLTCALFMCLYLGWEMFVVERFDLEKALQTIQDQRITGFYVSPPVVLAFGKSPLVDKYDLSTLKVMHSGAAPLTSELTEAVWQRLKIPVKQGYGLSESSPVVTCQTVDEWAKFMGSCGKMMPNMEAKLVDEQGKEVADGEVGELWIKGPNVFKGYYKNPERTKEAFSEDGYFKTGDMFHIDKHGNMYCVDRLKELIKYKGFPVPPAELEGLILGHSDVTDVCVIGVEDHSQATEVPRAYVVLRPGVQANDNKAQEIVDYVAKQVAPHKKLRGGVRFVAEVPKSPSGKILRRLLRDKVRQEERAAGSKL